MRKIETQLTKLDACESAMAWVRKTPGTFAQMWAACPEPDWLLWLAGKMVDKNTIVLAGCDCARTALQFVPAGEDRPRLAIEAAEGFVAGTVTRDQLVAAANNAAYAAAYGGVGGTVNAAYAAANSAYTAANAANATASHAATAAAADAAYTANAAATAAANAYAYTANAAAAATAAANAYAANAAAYADTRTKHARLCCDLIRKRIPAALVRRGLP